MPNITIEYRQFPNNNQLTMVGSIPVMSGASFPLTAPSGLTAPNPADPDNPYQYGFLFWNVGGTIDLSATTVAGPVDTNVNASAWYIRTGGGDGPPTARCWAFSISDNQFRTETPIASVTGGTWPANGDDHNVLTAPAASTITAKDVVQGDDFSHWAWFGDASAAVKVLSVPQGKSPLAFAYYKKDPVPWTRFDWRKFLDLILVHKHVDPKDLVGDSSPIDVLRLGAVLQRLEVAGTSREEVEATVARADRMSDGELREALLGIRTDETRLTAARKQLEAVMKKRRG